MSDLQQATVKLVLDALHPSNLTIESFIMIMMAISAENIWKKTNFERVLCSYSSKSSSVESPLNYSNL